ncbi:MAG: hypothetical protein SGILL_006565, partial [Bacillariaceae sp.]
MKTLTFEETLRPESVEEVDANHPWNTFFCEARGEMPIAVAEPVEDDGADTGGNSDPVVNAEVVVAANNAGKGSSFVDPTSNQDDQEQPMRSLGRGCFYIEGVVGSSLAISAALIVFSLELVGAIVYCLAVGFYLLASDDSYTPALFKAILMLVVHVLMLVDSICLFCSVIVSEVLA